MDDFEFAWRVERQTEINYLVLAKIAPSEWIRHLFFFLANEEKRHYEAIQRLEHGEFSGLPESPSASEPAIRPHGREFPKGLEQTANRHLAVYRAVRDREKEFESFYRLKAKKAAAGKHQEFFLALADEEREHYELLDAMVDVIESSVVLCGEPDFRQTGFGLKH